MFYFVSRLFCHSHEQYKWFSLNILTISVVNKHLFKQHERILSMQTFLFKNKFLHNETGQVS